MKIKHIIIVCFACLLLATPALAAPNSNKTGIYVSGKVIGTYQTHKVTGYIDGENMGRIGDKSDGSFGGALAVGYDFYRDLDIHLRLELEYGLNSKTSAKESVAASFSYPSQPNPINVNTYESYKVEMGIQTAFINAYYDFDTGTMFTPYIGAGVGLAFIDTKGSMHGSINEYAFNGSTGSKSTTNFAWQVGAGVAVDLTESVALDAGYRFVSVGSAKTKTAVADLGSFGSMTMHGKTKNIYLHQFYLGARYKF